MGWTCWGPAGPVPAQACNIRRRPGLRGDAQTSVEGGPWVCGDADADADADADTDAGPSQGRRTRRREGGGKMSMTEKR